MSATFEGLEQLIACSNMSLIDEVLMPQIMALEDEEERNILLKLVNKKGEL